MVESLLTNNETQLLGDDDDDDYLFVKPKKKFKILWLSDHPLSTSGVGVQSRILIDGLLKTGKYSFRCLGGAIRHDDYRTIVVNPDFVIKPVDGFGTKEQIRQLLVTERPDALFFFTDPRQFVWLWEMEDEIRQVCPLVYWHVWDNDPYPAFNRVFYEGTDSINCISKKTYDLIKPNFPEKTNYIPHAWPKELFYRLNNKEIAQHKRENFGPRAEWFKALWVNRNASRKVPSDVIEGWGIFLDKLEAKHGHRNASLIMHTDPNDMEGPNLLAVTEQLKLQDNVWFSTEKLDFPKMNILHNMADCQINISKAEGFGLSTLISLQVGRPIVALCTGGETDKAIDSRDGSANGIALKPIKRQLVGSQMVPYIYEDFADLNEVADGFMKLYEMGEEEKKELSQKCVDFAEQMFSYQDMVDNWDKVLTETIEGFQKSKQDGTFQAWTATEIKVAENYGPRPVVPSAPATTAPKAAPVVAMPKVKKLERKKKEEDDSQESK